MLDCFVGEAVCWMWVTVEPLEDVLLAMEILAFCWLLRPQACCTPVRWMKDE